MDNSLVRIEGLRFIQSLMGEYTKRQASKVFRSAVLRLFLHIVQLTPVKTGLLRGSWRTSVKWEPEGSTGNTSIIPVVTEIYNVTKNLNWMDTVYFGNETPYFDLIENKGWSKKAPRGMVKPALAQWPIFLDEAIRRHT